MSMPCAAIDESNHRGRGFGSLAHHLRSIFEVQPARRVPPTATALDCLEPTMRAKVWTTYGGPCEAAFEFLAQNHPSALLMLVESNKLEPTDLTFAAEIAGRITEENLQQRVRRALLPLLNHSASYVREGAVYGLANHHSLPVRRALEKLVESDESPGVKTVARDCLASW